MLRVVEHLAARPLFHNLAGVHHADSIAQRSDDAQVVGDHQHSRAGGLAQLANQVEHLGFDSCIEAGGRLVEHQQFGVAGKRHGDDHSLLHATGQLERVAIHHSGWISDTHAAQRLQG